jgi:exodeoxyribonuclease VII large subunit
MATNAVGKLRENVLSVYELNKLINTTLTAEFPLVIVEGEIGQLTISSVKHFYFTLKDSNTGQASVLSCVMWGSNASKLTFKLEQGALVRCWVRPGVYAPQGRLQCTVDKISLSGEGALAAKFEALKQKLDSEGLFDQARKRPLPFFPKTIGIVTSATGAVIHDIMVKIRERMPSTEVYLADCKVQGEGSAEELVQGLKRLQEIPEVEVIIVARGGGSLEDLWSFNEEAFVRAVFACSKPTISGVGHEVDVTLCDFVADKRAPTPTAAAEMVVPHRIELLRIINEYSRRLLDTDRWMRQARNSSDQVSQYLAESIDKNLFNRRVSFDQLRARHNAKKPELLFNVAYAKLHSMKQTLHSVCFNYASSCRQRLMLAEVKLTPRVLTKQLDLKRTSVLILKNQVSRLVETNLERQRDAFKIQFSRLGAINPKSVLKRGYCLVKVGSKYITNVDELAVNQKADILFENNSAHVQVLAITK